MASRPPADAPRQTIGKAERDARRAGEPVDFLEDMSDSSLIQREPVGPTDRNPPRGRAANPDGVNRSKTGIALQVKCHGPGSRISYPLDSEIPRT